jgi:ABC-2 type transport system ATP-binding protein
MENNIIQVKNVSMRFNLSKEKVDSLKEYVVKLIKHELMFEEFWALKNVSFDIKKGESVGIVGLNGSGKSTLLKIIAGVLKPTKGTVNVFGTIAPLIELGAGFDMDLTARENVILNGAILGYPKKLMREKYDEIIDFSELHEFVDVPVKNFSSGMVARLGFSIATVVRPEILIVDEILSVGDFLFQEKCEQRMKEMMSGGTTVIFVSHSLSQVKKICDKAIWVKKGEIVGIGEAEKICEQYVYSS